MYAPLNARQRNYDCFSRTFALGIAVHGYSKYFNGPWTNAALAWISVILKVIFDGYAIYGMTTTCIRQLRYSENVPWEKEFGVKGTVEGYLTKADDETLEQIKDHATSNGDDPSTWDEKKTAVLAKDIA